MSPKKRWLKDASRIEYLDEEKIRVAFLWRELRTPDKTAVVKLFTRSYKVSTTLAKQRVEVRYDPEHLDTDRDIPQRRLQTEGQAPSGLTKPRRLKKLLPVAENPKPQETVDYLAWLTQTHKKKTKITPGKADEKSQDNLQGFLDLLRQHIHPDVFDLSLATEFFDTFGPFDMAKIKQILADLLAAHPSNLHLSFYLNHIQDQLFGGQK